LDLHQIGTRDPFFTIKIGKIFSVNLTNFANFLGKVRPIFQYEKKMKLKIKNKKIPRLGRYKM
jgi:murein endopeptidase